MGVVGQQFDFKAKVARQLFLRLHGIDQQHGIGGTVTCGKSRRSKRRSCEAGPKADSAANMLAFMARFPIKK